MAQEEGYALKLGWEELSESLLYDIIQKLINQQSSLCQCRNEIFFYKKKISDLNFIKCFKAIKQTRDDYRN